MSYQMQRLTDAIDVINRTQRSIGSAQYDVDEGYEKIKVLIYGLELSLREIRKAARI